MDVYDNGVNGAGGDMNIYASNDVWPNAFVGAISQTTGRIYLPPLWANVPWTTRDGYGTFIHEFGHYGLYLYDEDLKGDGSSGGFCTHNRGNDQASEPVRASIMDRDDISSEFCHTADPTRLHNTDTEQDAENNGETTWDTIVNNYEHHQTYPMWLLQTPETRNVTVVTGPTALPISSWMKVNVTDADTNQCAPFAQTFVYREGGAAVAGADVTLDRQTGTDIYQGKTSATGKITIWGAYDGDTVKATIDSASISYVISCTPAAQGAPAAVTQAKELAPDPFSLSISVIPVSAYGLQVQVRASVVLPSAPVVELWQDAASQPINVDLTYSSALGLYTGNVTLDETYEARGRVQVAATNPDGSVWRQQAFNIVSIHISKSQHLYSEDSNLEVVLPEGA